MTDEDLILTDDQKSELKPVPDQMKLVRSIINLIPIDMVIWSTWDYKYLGTLTIETDENNNTLTVYVFNVHGRDRYFTIEYVNEKFDILNLARKLIDKELEYLSKHHIQFLHSYFKYFNILGGDKT